MNLLVPFSLLNLLYLYRAVQAETLIFLFPQNNLFILIANLYNILFCVISLVVIDLSSHSSWTGNGKCAFFRSPVTSFFLLLQLSSSFLLFVDYFDMGLIISLPRMGICICTLTPVLQPWYFMQKTHLYCSRNILSYFKRINAGLFQFKQLKLNHGKRESRTTVSLWEPQLGAQSLPAAAVIGQSLCPKT